MMSAVFGEQYIATVAVNGVLARLEFSIVAFAGPLLLFGFVLVLLVLADEPG
jgi:hypothetical protein